MIEATREGKKYIFDGNLGSIELLGVFGKDVDIVNAARVSFDKEVNTMSDRDRKLLKYLIANGHTSPLEMVSFKFRVVCPIPVARQWFRHRTGKYNEVSRRYTEENITFAQIENFRAQSESNRQASDREIIARNSVAKSVMEKATTSCKVAYHDLLDLGVCREQARFVLPQSTHTKFLYKTDLNNLIKFVSLRDHPSAQKEIACFARAIKRFIGECLPDFYEAWQQVEFEKQSTFEMHRQFMERAGQEIPSKPQADRELAKFHFGLIKEEFLELENDVKQIVDGVDSPEIIAAAAKEAADLIYVSTGFLRGLGLDPEKVVREVSRANLEKVSGPIDKREDGKVLKPKDYKKADIISMVTPQKT